MVSAWAIDNIPSLVRESRDLAGAGPLSDGIPERIGSDSETRLLPPPIGKLCVLVEEEATKPVRLGAKR
jgi:hypothetical protein